MAQTRNERIFMATKSKNSDTDDAPLIDLTEASIKKLITRAKKRGYVTVEELRHR